MARTRAAPSSPASSTAPAVYEYRLGAADKVRIIVFGEDSLTGEFFVSGSGTISFPLIGEVNVLGLTLPQVADAIAA